MNNNEESSEGNQTVLNRAKKFYLIKKANEVRMCFQHRLLKNIAN